MIKINIACTFLSSLLLTLCLTANRASAQCQSLWNHHQVGGSTLVNSSRAWDPDGAGPLAPQLLIAGAFTSVDGVAANGVAAFDVATQSWTSFGPGLLHEIGDVRGDANGNLVAGGFIPRGGPFPPVNGRVDIWDGTSWTTLPLLTGGSLLGGVSAVAFLPNGDIVAGGDFTLAGGVSVNNIARWDGTAWNALGAGMPPLVRSIEVRPSGDLVAGSLFPLTPGAAVLATWNGTSWTPLGSGTATSVEGISSLHYLPGGDLLATGLFVWPTPAPLGRASVIARWDGSAWSDMNAGPCPPDPSNPSGPVFSGPCDATVAVTSLPNGDVIAGGSFSQSGGVSTNHVARWDGSAWSALGAGLGAVASTDQVLTLTTMPGGEVFAAGFFSDLMGASSSLASLTCGAPDCDGDGISDADEIAGGAPDANMNGIPDDCETMASLCTGDGGDQMGCTDCPCMNNAPVGSGGGCLNSNGTGSKLIASGDPSVSLPVASVDDLRFSATNGPPNQLFILNSGNALAPADPMSPCFGLNSGAGGAAFDGLRCAIIGTLRNGGRGSDSNGEVGMTNSPWGGESNPPGGIAQFFGYASGTTKYFQCIHRDSATVNCMTGLNTTQAIEVTFTP